jgi:hypothetical protein
MRPRTNPERPPAGSALAAHEKEFEAALNAVCRGIRDPVVKLRFIREALGHCERLQRRVGWIPLAFLRRTVYRWLSIEKFRPLLARGGLTARARLALQRSLWAGRALAAAATLAAFALAGGLVVGVLVVIPSTLARTTRPSSPASPASAASAPLVEPTPRSFRASPPVWLVEKGTGWEQYSNGLRIDTTLTVPGEKRRFHVFDRGGMRPEVNEAPVGIVFHTSESDIWPLEETFNESLRDSSQRLLRYIRGKELYNYVIDRFGRVYRVVDDASRANHAGYSIWAYHERFYLNLNHAFLGICFETRWEGGRALPITPAQFTAGHSLTECLRQRFGIAAEMCVAHGLTSVNPTQHLIGHHVDWARGFPFRELGLPDQYDRSTPSVEVFGFGYDEHFLAVMGEPWPGVRAAEAILAAEAARQGTTVDELRRERQALYDTWVAQQRQAQEDESGESRRAGPAPRRGPHGG